jgi:phage terminase large subunit-like protein
MKPADFDSLLESLNSPEFVRSAQKILPNLDTEAKSTRAIKAVLDLVDKYNNSLTTSGSEKWFVPGTPYSIDNCPKHKAFFDASKDYTEILFCAGNRVGKSLSGAYATACHLTGLYPEWWTGKRFDQPIRAWAAGSDAKSTRDTVQKELLGPIGAPGTGLIPMERIGKAFALSGVPQGVDTVQVRHVSGGWSTISFKNYQQALSAYYGTAMDWIWLDEICPVDIYNECLIRTMTTNGIVTVTFTPLEGITPLIVNFFSKATLLAGSQGLKGVSKEELEETAGAEGQDLRLLHKKTAKCIITAGWDDAPWLGEDAKARMLDDTPPHLRAARSKGEPAMGSGNVYSTPLDEILIDPFPIPDYYERLYALDVGWNRTAVAWGAKDPDSGIVYVIDEHYLGREEPPIHAAAIRSRGEWMEGVIDPAARGRSQIDGSRLIELYRELGLKLYPAKNEVEGGIQVVQNALATGKLKVFKTLQNIQKEYTLYRRDLNGKIIKENDHLMDCLRYLLNNPHRYISKQAYSHAMNSVYKGTLSYDI